MEFIIAKNQIDDYKNECSITFYYEDDAFPPFRDPALPSYPILTYYCLTTLIFASETRGNQKCFKKLELWRVSGMKTTEPVYCAPQRIGEI